MADDQTAEPDQADDVDDAQQPESTDEDARDEQLGESGKKALEEERRARKAEAKRAKELETRLREFEDAGKSEQEKLLERLKLAEEEATSLRSEATRQRVANKYGLGDLASVLAGDEDAMEATAKLLQKRLKAVESAQEPPSFDGGPRTPAPRGADMNALIRQAAGRA